MPAAIPILVVDDERNFLQLMERTLAKKGFEVHAADSVAKALQSLQKEFFSFALVDLRINGKDSGLELLGELKRRQPKMHTIMITAYPSEESRAEAAARGAEAYLVKPASLDVLLDTFTTILTAN
jgi:ActR/RegA family two-component response regulator